MEMRNYKRLILIVTFLIFLVLNGNLFSAEIPGSQIFYLGNGISFFPLGGSGVSTFMSMDSGLYNPAAYGDTKRITADISLGGFGSSDFLMNGRVSFPTNYGVLSGNFVSQFSPSGINAGDIFNGRFSFSKYISDEWLFGSAINLGYANGLEKELIASLDLGTIYRKSVGGTGLGLFDYSVGASLKNLGKNVSYTGYDTFPPMGIDVGGSAEVARKGFYKGRILTHLLVPVNPFHLFWGFGVENIFFDMVNVKIGLNLGAQDVSPLSFGFDINFGLKDYDVQVSYSLLPVSYNGKKEYLNNAGVSVAFGTYDKKPPKIAVLARNEYFSPNHDGINDNAHFDLKITDNTMVFGWKLDILDQEGKPVKSFVAQDVRKIKHMTLEKYIKRIFAKKEEVKIPEYIEWDGENSEGRVVPDGYYYYVLSAWDENNNKSITDKKLIIVDTVVPLVEATPATKELLFSPNGDGVKDALTINIKSKDIAKDDTVVLKILDKDKNVVLKKEYTGRVPDRFVWDGRNNDGLIVPEGVYTFIVEAYDKASNRSSSKIDGIILKTKYERISASPIFRAFSPNGDGFFDIDDIRLFASSKEGLIDWELDVLNEENQVVRKFSGKRDFPYVISFNGKDENGRRLKDGRYILKFRVNYESGNHPEEYFKYIVIDTTPPKISLSMSSNAFSPNGDGIKDTVSISQKIEAGEGDVFEAKIVNSVGATFKTFNFGTNPPSVVVWDGMGDNNKSPVEGMYTYIIVGKDKVGNSTTATIGPIKLVTGFEEISIVSNYFAFSPNGDGNKDTVTLNLNTNNKEGIVSWKVVIKSNSQKVVRSFNNENMGKFLPDKIEWDGKDDTGNVVPDGIYTVAFSILYDSGNNPISKPKDIKVDVKAPTIEVYAKDLYISPNNDGSKETIKIYQKIVGEENDNYEAKIVNYAGEIVKDFKWKGLPPSEVVWDGRNAQGEPLPEGIYNYIIVGKDVAGNITKKQIKGIKLVTRYEKVTIVSDQEGISPNNDGYFDYLEIVPSISSDKDLENWFIGIMDYQGKVIKRIKGEGIPPTIIRWDGTDENGKIVRDAIYSFNMKLKYRSGNHPVSNKLTVIVDRTPPDYKFVASPKLFSPDGDGEADTLYLNLDVHDTNGVAQWQVNIYRKWNDKIDKSSPFKTFKGKGNYKGVIKWDGYSDPVPMPSSFRPPDNYTYKRVNGDWKVLVDSASSYAAVLTTSDIYKNSTEAERDFDTDILVIKTPYGLKIMINSIQFEFDKADLLPSSYPILNRLIQILDKFPNYKIKIVGHTDSVGPADYNMKLSEKRAYSVYEYLVEHDVDKERLSIEGRGETQPIDDNSTESGRARNRRVEFYLTKK